VVWHDYNTSQKILKNIGRQINTFAVYTDSKIQMYLQENPLVRTDASASIWISFLNCVIGISKYKWFAIKENTGQARILRFM
jgi:hypothetical protein